MSLPKTESLNKTPLSSYRRDFGSGIYCHLQVLFLSLLSSYNLTTDSNVKVMFRGPGIGPAPYLSCQKLKSIAGLPTSNYLQVGIEPNAGASRASEILQTKEYYLHNFVMHVIAVYFKGKDRSNTPLTWKLRTREERAVGYIFFFHKMMQTS